MSEGPILRLSRVLDERAIPLDPVIAVVNAVRPENVFLGIGTVSDRVTMLVPTREAIPVVAPGTKAPDRSMMLVSAYRADPLQAALVIGGPTTAQAAMDEVGTPAGRLFWSPVLQTLSAGTIRNRTRYLGEDRATISVMFPPRTGDAESSFATALASVATKVGAPDNWRAVYAAAGAGAEVGVTTECTARGLSPNVALRFGPTTWDRAIDLAKGLVDTDRARDAAVRMGTLAAGLEVRELRGVEAVIDAAAPDLIVWLVLRR